MAAAEPLAVTGHSRHSGFVRAELDWYVEPASVIERLLDHENFRGHLIWDPACGQGTILDVCAARGLEVAGSDVVDRGAARRHSWWPVDFLATGATHMFSRYRSKRFAIISNPPYGRLEKGMKRGDTYAERFIRRALATGADKVAMIVNGKFLWSERRWRLFHEEHPPTQILFCSDRPSMPPGHELHRLKEIGRAYSNGSIDYAWMLWVRGATPRPPVWLRPSRTAIGTDFEQGG